MPPTQIYESAERGVIDGNVMPWGPVGAFKLHEVFKNHLNARIDAVAMYTLINERRYNALPPDIRKLIDDGKPLLRRTIGASGGRTPTTRRSRRAKKAGNKVRRHAGRASATHGGRN